MPKQPEPGSLPDDRFGYQAKPRLIHLIPFWIVKDTVNRKYPYPCGAAKKSGKCRGLI
jgi:hypothetical protein